MQRAYRTVAHLSGNGSTYISNWKTPRKMATCATWAVEGYRQLCGAEVSDEARQMMRPFEQFRSIPSLAYHVLFGHAFGTVDREGYRRGHPAIDFAALAALALEHEGAAAVTTRGREAGGWRSAKTDGASGAGDAVRRAHTAM